MPQNPRAALIAALRRNLSTALRRGQLDEARALLPQLKLEDAVSATTQGFELELLVAGAQWREAGILAEQLLRLYPISARIHFLAARVFYQKRDYALARDALLEAQRLHPHWSLQRWLARTYTQQGEYDLAESLLSGLQREHPLVLRDLAWLYERRQQPQQALRCIQEYLALRPQDLLARDQQARLSAVMAPAEDLIRDVEQLDALGEEIAPAMLPAYVQRLLESGRSSEARRFVDENLARWPEPVTCQVGWECYRLHAYDLALRAFLAVLLNHLHDFKLLAAMEASAHRCQRVGDIKAAYGNLAAEQPHLYGRLRALARRRSGKT